MKPTFVPEKILVVEWVDPDTTSGWVTPEEALDSEGATAVSVGIFVGETEEFLLLALDWATDGAVNSRGRIYKPLIKRMKELSFPAAFKPKGWRRRKETSDG